MNEAARESVDALLQRVAEVTDTQAFTKAQVITLAALIQAALDDTLEQQRSVGPLIKEGLDLVMLRLDRLFRRSNWLEWLLLLSVISNVVCWYWLSRH